MKKRNSAALLIVFTAALILLLCTIGADSFNRADKPDAGQTKIIFFTLGNADSILIQDGSGQTMLIDTGDNAHEEGLVRSLHMLGVTRIDILLLTHPHEDHIGGADAVMKDFDIGEIYMPEVSKDSASFTDLLEAAQEKGLLFTAARSGVEFDLGINRFSILSPDENAQYSDMNDYSVVLSAQIRGTHFYFMGDATETIENQLLSRNELSRCDVLKVGHHGSDTSSTGKFLTEAMPRYAVISCDEDGPSANVASRLAAIDAQTYITGVCGTVILTVDSNGIAVQTEYE